VLHPEKTKVEWSTVRTPVAEANTRSCSSTSSATRSGRGWRSGEVDCMGYRISPQQSEGPESDPSGDPEMVTPDPERQSA
jgi:hypothetical protein